MKENAAPSRYRARKIEERTTSPKVVTITTTLFKIEKIRRREQKNTLKILKHSHFFYNYYI